MTIKEARVEFRLDAESKARIERAAMLNRESVSAFVVDAATAAADRVLARADVTMMPAEQFDELFASLETADEAPALAHLGKRGRRYVRK
ncbi:type II toxin -antitoxin system TacA 1-like antitoxin [Crossiella sp. CA198]|uniref:type II toxin -antitoxin system TacA 1-like antitoxin n=1 Tax=Crossiella sp. CA198 TaxID=3455607 RepID=UPI003F8D48D1